LVEADAAGKKESLSDRHDRILAQLQQLNLEEKADYDNILDGPLPDGIMEVMNSTWYPPHQPYAKHNPKPYVEEQGLNLRGINFENLLRDHTFCTYSQMPAEIRFKGLVMETGNNGDVYERTFDTGYAKSYVNSVTRHHPFTHTRPGANPDVPPIVTGWTDGSFCDYELDIDKQDYWLVAAFDGWRKMLVPNNAEKAYYTQYDAKKANGWIIFCLDKCSWGACDLENHHDWLFGKAITKKGAHMKYEPPPPEQWHKMYGTVEMKVNGVDVREAKTINRKCTILTHQGKTREEQYKWEPNKNGQFEFEFRIKDAKMPSFLRFTSIILL
jgi:hypothetical protein